MAPTPSLFALMDEQLTAIFDKVCQLHNAPYKKYFEEIAKGSQLADESEKKIEAIKAKALEDEQRLINEAKIEVGMQVLAQQKLTAIEQRLAQYYPRSKVNFSTVQSSGAALDPDNENSVRAVEQIILQIADTSGGAMLKKFSGIWPNDNQAAGDLYLRIDKAMKTSRQTEQRAKDHLAKQQEALVKQLKDFDQAEGAKLHQLKQSLEAALSKANAQAMSKIRYTLSDPLLINPLKTSFRRIAPLRGSEEGWAKYEPAKEVPFEFLIGKALVPLDSGFFNHYNWLTNDKSRTMRDDIGPEVEKCIPLYNHKAGGFVMPWTEKRNHNILIFAETEGGIYPSVGFFQDIVMRQLRFMPPKTNRFIYIDPVGLGANVGQMINLTEAQGGCGACKVVVKGDEISDIIGNLAKFVTKVRMTLTASNQVDISNYNETVSESKRIPYTTLVIHDFPKGFSAQAIQDLRTLTQQSDDCGLTILISHSKQVPMDDAAKNFLKETEANDCLWTMRFDQNNNCRIIDGGYDVPFKRIEVQPSDVFFKEYNAAYSYKPPVYNNLEHFFPLDKPLPAWKPWSKELRFPFAVDAEGNLVDFCLDIDEKGYGLVTGSTGSGKTTFLHSIILGAAMHYHPEELEIWLADYKIAEFAPYGKGDQLPHIRYIVTDQSQLLIYSIIETLQKEIKNRAKLFVQAGAKDFEAYRSAGYKMPKILLIVDEFHRMSQAVHDDMTYRTNIHNVIAEARSHGINIIFSDQSMAGMSGLKQDTQDLIRVRIALKHVPQQVKETLALSEAPDERLSQQIKDLELTPQGGMIYKHAEPDPNAPKNKKIMHFDSLRGLYASPKVRSSIIAKINAKVGQFGRPLDVYDGPKRLPLDSKAVEQYEEIVPVDTNEGKRFYIGSPQGIGKCFYFNLKRDESGENILLVGNQNEMRASLLKSVVRNARRHEIKTVVLAPKFSMFYAKNKELLQDMENIGCNVISGFGAICQYIGDYALSHRKAFPDTDDEVVMPENIERTLIICPAVDELCARMQKQKNKSYVKALAEWRSEIEAWQNGGESLPPKSEPVPVPGSEPEPEPNWWDALDTDTLEDSLAKTEEKMKTAGLAEEQPEDTLEIIGGDSVSEVMAGPGIGLDGSTEMIESDPMPVFKGYDATDDLVLLVEEGWKLSMHTMFLTDNAKGLKAMRYDCGLKTEGNFNHRIGLRMTEMEALEFLSTSRIMKAISDENDVNSAVYEYMGGSARRFCPYL